MDFGEQTAVQHPSYADAPRPLCHCLNVSESEVRDAIAEHNPQSIRGVSQACGAGSGCMSCHRHIRRLLNERALLRRSQLLDGTEPAVATQAHCGS